MKIFEAIATGIEDVFLMQHFDVDRIELITGFSEGGVTPSYGCVNFATKISKIPIMLMIRPRGGNFAYTYYEIDQMIYDIEMAKQQNIHGVVLGTLTYNNDIDHKSLEKILKHCSNLEVTFHRAFSQLNDPIEGLNILSSLGVHRVLTGAIETNYANGIVKFKKLLEVAGDNIIIMPGGGFREDNISAFLNDVPSIKEIHIGTGIREKHDCLLPINRTKLNNIANLVHKQ